MLKGKLENSLNLHEEEERVRGEHFLRIFRPHGSSCTGTAVRLHKFLFLLLWFPVLFSHRCRVRFFVLTPILWEKLSDRSPDFLSWRLALRQNSWFSHLLPGRAIHWSWHPCRGFWKMVYRALRSPRRLASRQFLLSRLQAQVRRRPNLHGNPADCCILRHRVCF